MADDEQVVDGEEWLAGNLGGVVKVGDTVHRPVGTWADFSHPGPWRYFPVPQPTMIGHNDIAPYNACFDGDDLVGVFDWDLSGPTNALNELAFMAWNCVPLWADIGADEAARRLTLITGTYGGFGAGEVLLAVPGRIQLMMDGIVASAAAGDPGMVNLVEGGEPERDRASVAGLKSRIPRIMSQLA